jgi:transcriptional regulator with XRE-family HTH domain
MKDRLKELMVQLSISAAELADKIGVQRSSISHILNGRNLPSSQFLEKLLNTYPEVDARWLMTGKGGIYRQDNISNPGESIKRENVHSEEIKNSKTPKDENPSAVNPGKKIEKVLFFYPDRSFSEYYPLQ